MLPGGFADWCRRLILAASRRVIKLKLAADGNKKPPRGNGFAAVAEPVRRLFPD
jgi:hypothetical protein